MSTLIWITLTGIIAFLLGVLACRALARRHFRAMSGLPDPDSIERIGEVELGGVPQWVSIRGQSRHNPVLLFLHGGPGTTFSGVAYSHQAAWEEYFTVVNWDQRGSGRSRHRGDQAIGLETLVSDAVELIDYLRRELNQDKIFLFGHSWGGFLGLTITHRRPELLHAFIGLGPLLGIQAGYQESRRVLIEAATAAGDTKTLEKLCKSAPELPNPAEPEFLKTLGAVLGFLPKYGMSWHNQTSMAALFTRVLTTGFFSPHLKLRQIAHPLAGTRAYVLGLFREIYAINLPTTLGPRFETPVILVSGEYDQQSPIALVRKFAAQIDAPHKAFRVLQGCAHVGVWEAPGQILEVLIKDALPLAGSESGSASEDNVSEGKVVPEGNASESEIDRCD